MRKLYAVTIAALFPLLLSACISSSSPPPPATIVVPQGNTVICSNGAQPPCQ
jgi:hypothetical protein